MRYMLKTEKNENGNEVFSKEKVKGNFIYLAKAESGQTATVNKEWVLKHKNDIVNLNVSSDNRLIVKSNKPFGKTQKANATLSIEELKQRQLRIIQQTNSMTDDYHVGIRCVEDIKAFEEAMQDDESFCYGDFEFEDAQVALRNKEVKVFSSKPIVQGSFVSTSKNMARDYAGNNNIYEKVVKLTDVAWINGDEGQYAKVV